MKAKDKALRALLDSIARPDDRSPLFWWLLDHHDSILDAAAGRRMRWATLCAHFAELGLTDTTGKPPTERNARETWLQVRKEAARLRQAPPAGKPIPPARPRLPADWRPPLAPPPPPPVQSAGTERSRRQMPAGYRPEDDETLPEHVRQQFRQLTHTLEYTDRHITDNYKNRQKAAAPPVPPRPPNYRPEDDETLPQEVREKFRQLAHDQEHGYGRRPRDR